MASLLDHLAVYRVMSRRSLVARCFDGHPFAANRTIADLERRGLVERHLVDRGKHGFQVFSLTERGRRRAVERRKKDGGGDGQRLWSGVGDARQLDHDQSVAEAVMQDAEPVVRSGGRIRRVRLDSEIRGALAAADDAGRRRGGPAEARRARRAAAAGAGLGVVDGAVPLPDAVVELEHADGRVEMRSIEVVSPSYSGRQVAQKRGTAFRVYSQGPAR